MSLHSSMSTLKEHRLSIGAHMRKQAAKKANLTIPSDLNLKGTLLNFTLGHDHRPYQDLVCILRDSEIKDGDLCLLLQNAQDCISLLDQNLRLFVQVLLVVKWAHRGAEAVKAFQDFLLNLCSAHSYHTKAVIDHLIKSFMSGSEWSSAFPSESDEGIFENVHCVLRKLLKVIPMAGEILVQCVVASYPYQKRQTSDHQAYVHNLLTVISYQPNFRKEFLHLIVNKMVQLDVCAPRSEIEAAEEEGDEDMEVDSVFGMEKDQEMRHPEANTLDLLMLRLFKFIEHECSDLSSGQISIERSNSVYKEFIEVFEKVILSTHNTHHVQFLMWYLCSLRPKLGEVFVKYLWNQVSAVNVPPVTRQTAAAYISSFLARAAFIKIEYLKTTLQDISTWIHGYINNQDDQSCMDVRLHTVFFSVCQGLFYLIAFRHRDLFNTKQNVVFLQGLNLSKVVTCRLNPLRVCLPEIAKKFASVTRINQLVYCNTILERNARNCMPVVNSRGGAVYQSNWLETFFPFDPYKLTRTAPLILPHYNSYKADDIVEESSSKQDDDDDDYLSEASVNEKRFLLSTSPGFLYDVPMSAVYLTRGKDSV